VVTVGLTLGDAPPGTAVPPQLPVNHSILSPPAPGKAVSSEACPRSIAKGLATVALGTAGKGLIVTVTLAQVDALYAVSQRA
jgi:hypothetical protein